MEVQCDTYLQGRQRFGRDLQWRMIWIVDVHGYGKRFIVRADEMLTAFVEVERAIHEFAVSLVL